MDVILLQRVEKLGAMGQVVKVKDGYARNYLLPLGKALRATAANRAKYEADRVVLEAKNAERRTGAAGEAQKLDGKNFIVIRQAGETGQLYGSVSPRDIAEAVSTSGVAVSRTHVMLDTPIKAVGLHQVRIALHPEVITHVTINVARSNDEAEAQLRGEKLGSNQDDREEARAAAAALFEDEELAEDAVGSNDA
jgi:large subunit ribosomal protein L9